MDEVSFTIAIKFLMGGLSGETQRRNVRLDVHLTSDSLLTT